MKLDASEANRVEAARGFWELGLPQAALDELAELPEPAQRDPEVIEIRLTVLMEENRWNEALVEAETLCHLLPEEPIWWIQLGFCLHELKRTREAKERLLAGPPALRENAMFYYNLACYECQLGHVQEAWLLLERAIQLDPKFKQMAESDSDLEQLKKTFKAREAN